MKINNLILLFAIFTTMTLVSCGGNKSGNTEGEETEKTDATNEETATADKMDFSRGEEIYKTQGKCITCHMENGQGVPGAFPPLANSDYLLEDPKRAVAQVLNGSNETMVVNGETYTTPMEPQVDNYEDAVAVINYVLNQWGNDGGTISVEEVQDIEIKRK